jgi:hypothetical protein
VTPTIILLSVVTWIPRGNKGDDTEKNGFISPDFVKSFISELFHTDRSDSTSDDTGRVVVVGWEGGLRWTYTGHSKINVTTQFNPCDVVTTTAGHIIVCDFITHALHVLYKHVGCLNIQH